MKQKIAMNKLAQYRHIKVLNSLEKQSKLAYKLVMTSAIHEIKSVLRSEKLAKSDDEEKLPEGWTDEAPRVEFNISGVIDRVLDKHLAALRWVMMGDYAGKDAKAAAKEVGLIGKVTPGLVPSAYLQSIDSHREHHEDITGESAPDMPKDLLKESIKRIVQRADKFMKQFFETLKTATMHVVDKVAELRNYQILGKVLEEAHDNLPKDGKDAVSVAADGISDKLSLKELSDELDSLSETFENKWDLAAGGEIAAGSAVGTHQAMYEVYGSSTDNIRVAWIEMEDERVCSFCKNASKNPDGSHKYYKITDFKPAGYNYGKKKSDWQLTIVPAHPRCFVDDMSVLTKDGWKAWPDVTGKELFLSVNPDTGSSEWVHAVKLIQHRYTGPVHWYKNNNSDFAVTPNHTHVVKRKRGGDRESKIELVDDADLAGTQYSFLATIPEWKGAAPDQISIAGHTFNTLDFVRFMAIYLSEGNISRPKGRQWQIKISQVKHKEEFLRISKSVFDKVWDGKEAHYIPLDDETLAEWFRKFGKSWEKYIPEEILNLDKALLREFLTYYRMGDGNLKENNPLPGAKQKSYTETIFTSSHRMMSDICEVVLKLGLRPRYRLDPAKVCHHRNGDYLTKHPCWRITVGKKGGIDGYNINKECMPYNGYVYDVELERNNTLIVSRNGRVMVSGNCRCALVYVPAGFEVDSEGSLVKKKKTT